MVRSQRHRKEDGGNHKRKSDMSAWVLHESLNEAKCASPGKHAGRCRRLARMLESQIELDRELQESGSQDRLCLLPVREGVALCQYDISIERVEDVDARRHANPVEPERLAKAQVELVQPLAVQRLRGDDVDLSDRAIVAQAASERRRDHRVRVD